MDPQRRSRPRITSSSTRIAEHLDSLEMEFVDERASETLHVAIGQRNPNLAILVVDISSPVLQHMPHIAPDRPPVLSAFPEPLFPVFVITTLL